MNEPTQYPSDPQTERAMLGSMILNDAMAKEGLGLINQDCFYEGRNRSVFLAIEDLVNNEQVVDLITVSDKLKELRRLDEVGGYEYLSTLSMDVATSVHGLENYAQILVKKYARREIVDKSIKIRNNAINEDISVEKLLSQLEELSNNLRSESEAVGIEVENRGKIIKPQNIINEINRYYEKKDMQQGASLPWEQLTEHFRPAQGTLTVFTGIPGHGKSEFVDALMAHLAENHSWRWAIFSPENFPTEVHVQKIAEKYTGKPFFGTFRMDKDTLGTAVNWINSHFSWIDPGDRGMSIDAYLKAVLDIKKEFGGLDGCLLDPFNELDMNLKNGENEHTWIGKILSRCRRFARRHNIAFFIVAHPTKMYKKPGAKVYDVPTLYSISGSSHWYNKSDNGIVIYRNFGEKPSIDIHIQKIKFKWHGFVGMVQMLYEYTSGRFFEKKQIQKQKEYVEELKNKGVQQNAFDK